MKISQRIFFCTSLQSRWAGRQCSILGVALPEPVTTGVLSYLVSESSLCFQLCAKDKSPELVHVLFEWPLIMAVPQSYSHYP